MSCLGQDSAYPGCGDCWCVPSDGGNGPCPLWEPASNFSDEVVAVYQQMIPSFSYTLDCNPYDDDECQTVPQQTMVDIDSAVCAFKFADDDNTNGTACGEYTMVTYASRKEADIHGATVTHEGSCGLCSTAQDLSVYLVEDFTQAGKICATKGIFNEEKGLQCYMDIGLTKECAKIWNYDGIYDGGVCGATCMGDITSDNNGPPPMCELSKCLQCDEEKAGPLFSQFAARTRRRSGLRSEIVRNCSSIARIQHNPCENPACNC